MSVTKNIRGSLYRSHSSQARTVPTSTPAFADITITAASAAAIASCVSPTKSKYPGVSRKLILVSSHIIGTTAVLIEKRRFISSLS